MLLPFHNAQLVVFSVCVLLVSCTFERGLALLYTPGLPLSLPPYPHFRIIFYMVLIIPVFK